MPKETAESTKSETPKKQKGNSIQHDDKQITVTPKRNASTRSPLKGNPGEKQKDTKKSGESKTVNKSEDIEQTENNHNDDTTKTNHVYNNSEPTNDDHTLTMDTECQEHHMPLQTLLEELKDIKSSIQNLNAKTSFQSHRLQRSQ